MDQRRYLIRSTLEDWSTDNLPPTPMRLEDMLSSFQRHLRAASKAPRTIELYTRAFGTAADGWPNYDRPVTLDELTRPAMPSTTAGQLSPGMP